MPAPFRRVRRKPLTERLLAAISPLDFLLWLSEEIETRDWDPKIVGMQLGVSCNIAFLLARAQTGDSTPSDGVFDDGGVSWVSFIVHPFVWTLIALSLGNAIYTMTRSRHYRLFEVNVEQTPETPSAQRVRVQSSPVASSPLRFITNMIASESAESRAHPDKNRDVWELSVWDPLPVCLRLFCLFSPGHVLVYMLFLPLAPMDPRPSVTVFTVVLLQVILSGQLLFLQSRFTQQVKDTAIIHREVLHEYDTKFVHPRLHPVMRDVGTQLSPEETGDDAEFVETGTPTTLIKRSFRTNPNPNYVKHIDPDGSGIAHSNFMSPRLLTPAPLSRHSDASSQSILRSRSRQSLPANVTPAISRTSTASTGSSINFGGSMGAYTHNNSPLKKATSLSDMNERGAFSPRNSREMAAMEQRDAIERQNRRQGSPLKEDSRRPIASGLGTSANPFARRNLSQYERYPSMR